MWVLIEDINDENKYLSYVTENSFGEIYTESTSDPMYAIPFETEKDALDFRYAWGLRAWTKQI